MFLSISNTNPDPLYKQVIDGIKDAIFNGEIKEGDLLPSIRGMASELKISVITIKRAYAELESEGYIITRPGKGSFVTGKGKEGLKGEKMVELREKLKEIVTESKNYGIQFDEIIKLLKEIGGES